MRCEHHEAGGREFHLRPPGPCGRKQRGTESGFIPVLCCFFFSPIVHPFSQLQCNIGIFHLSPDWFPMKVGGFSYTMTCNMDNDTWHVSTDVLIYFWKTVGPNVQSHFEGTQYPMPVWLITLVKFKQYQGFWVFEPSHMYIYIYIYMDVYIRYYLHAFSDCWNIYTWKYLVLLLELNILQTFCNESWDLRSVKPIICIFFAAQICSIWNIPTARDVCGISRPPLRVPTWAHVQHVILMDHGEKNTLNNGETQGCSGGNKRTSLILDFEN